MQTVKVSPGGGGGGGGSFSLKTDCDSIRYEYPFTYSFPVMTSSIPLCCPCTELGVVDS